LITVCDGQVVNWDDDDDDDDDRNEKNIWNEHHLHEITFKFVKAIISLEKIVTDKTMELKSKVADPKNWKAWTIFLKQTLDQKDLSYLTKEAVNEINIVIDSLV